MRQLFLEKGVILVQKVAQPKLDERSVLVSVHYSFITAGTETTATANGSKTGSSIQSLSQKIKSVLSSFGRQTLQDGMLNKKRSINGIQALGYSCSGRVIATGSRVKTLRIGDLVACAGTEFSQCADIVCVPEDLVVSLSKPETIRCASATALGAVALQGIHRARLQIGQTVCVLGLGLLGQITAQLAKAAGCRVIGIDIIPERTVLAKELGADYVFQGDFQNLYKTVQFLTQHRGVDCTLVTASSDSNEIVDQAMQMTRRKGKIVIIGDVGLKLERTQFYHKEIDILSSCSYRTGNCIQEDEEARETVVPPHPHGIEKRNMQTVVDFLADGRLQLDRLISKEYHIDQATMAYEDLKTRKVLGAVLSYLPKNDFGFVPASRSHSSHKSVTFFPVQKGKFQIGVVGAGTFARTKLLPLIAGIEGGKIHAVADANVANAKNVARMYKAVKVFTDEQELFHDPSVDVIIVTAPHKFHGDQVVQALYNGKAVLMENPIATTFAQLDKLTSFLKSNPQARFCVDYYRSFSPFIQKIKWETVERYSPLVLSYRLNSGYVPQQQWLQPEVGFGGVIGEAYHIFDLFCFLTNATPRSVSVEALRPSTDDLFPTDNFCVQVSFDDGSICSLISTAIGHTGLGKERMELFFDSKSIVMDDFLSLRGYGTPHIFDETVLVRNEGHKTMITSFFDQLQKESWESPVALKRLTMGAKLTLIVDQLICQGGGEQEITLHDSTLLVPSIAAGAPAQG